MDKTTYRISNDDVLRTVRHEIEDIELNGLTTVTIETGKKKRSLNQNALAHKWLGLLADEVGEDLDTFKQDFKIENKYYKVHTRDGIPYIIIKSTADLDKNEFSEFMLKLEIRARFLDVRLPSKDYYGY